MSAKDYDSRWNEGADDVGESVSASGSRPDERDNKPVLEFDCQRYVLHRIRLLNNNKITNAEYVGSMLSLEILLVDLDTSNTRIAKLLAQSKKDELVRSRCKMQLRKLMEELG